MLGTLHERMGDTLEEPCVAATVIAPGAPVTCRSGIWGRVFGQQIKQPLRSLRRSARERSAARSPDGFDIWRGSLLPGHSDTAGIYFAYGNGHVDVDGLVTNAAATAYVLGHTGRWALTPIPAGLIDPLQSPSWYLDAVVQGTGTMQRHDAIANLPITGSGSSPRWRRVSSALPFFGRALCWSRRRRSSGSSSPSRTQ